MAGCLVVRTVRRMGTTIYGSYDQLVIEVSGVTRLRPHAEGFTPARTLVPVDLISRVSSAPAGRRSQTHAHVVSEIGSSRKPAVVIEVVGGAEYVVHVDGAEEVAADLTRRGVGNSPDAQARAVVVPADDRSRDQRVRRTPRSPSRS